MKTLDEIYKELESEDIKELDTAWKEAKKESEKSKKITLMICSIIDIFAIILLLESLCPNTSTSLFSDTAPAFNFP